MNNLKRNIDVENKDESTTIINEDNFEIINNSKFEDEINENIKKRVGQRLHLLWKNLIKYLLKMLKVKSNYDLNL